jgi:hypothetical protein
LLHDIYACHLYLEAYPSAKEKESSFGGDIWEGAAMSTWQAFLLGGLAVLTPSMLVVALMIRPLPTAEEEPDAPEHKPAPYGREYQA